MSEQDNNRQEWDKKPVYYALLGSWKLKRGSFQICLDNAGTLQKIFDGSINDAGHVFTANGLARSLANQGQNVCFVFNQRDLNEYPDLIPKQD